MFPEFGDGIVFMNVDPLFRERRKFADKGERSTISSCRVNCGVDVSVRVEEGGLFARGIKMAREEVVLGEGKVF